MNFKAANKNFQFALNLAIKWYGKFHTNTAKIYHYFGCFFLFKTWNCKFSVKINRCKRIFRLF